MTAHEELLELAKTVYVTVEGVKCRLVEARLLQDKGGEWRVETKLVPLEEQR